jgi:SRSO17 transposase
VVSSLGREKEQGRKALRLGLRASARSGRGREGSLVADAPGIDDPDEDANYLAYGPKETPVEELVLVAGRRWTIEECFEQAKGEVGLDEYEVRKWDGWHRHTTLSLLAHASGLNPELIPPTVPEVRRVILAMARPKQEREFRLE